MTEILDETGLLGEFGEIILMSVDAALKLEGKSGDVSVAVLDDEGIHELNARFRGVDSPTDVLSFPAGDDGFGAEDGFLGDIAISLPTAQRQANELGQSLGRELAFLTAHGVLHLLGYDHMDEATEMAMREKQRAVLSALEGRV